MAVRSNYVDLDDVTATFGGGGAGLPPMPTLGGDVQVVEQYQSLNDIDKRPTSPTPPPRTPTRSPPARRLPPRTPSRRGGLPPMPAARSRGGGGTISPRRLPMPGGRGTPSPFRRSLSQANQLTGNSSDENKKQKHSF